MLMIARCFSSKLEINSSNISTTMKGRNNKKKISVQQQEDFSRHCPSPSDVEIAAAAAATQNLILIFCHGEMDKSKQG